MTRYKPRIDRAVPGPAGRKRVVDRKYLDHLRDEPCILTGMRARPDETVDPMHIGTYGKGMKTDDEALPVLHHFHAEGHQHGEISMLRQYAQDWLVREAFRAYARELYRRWKHDGSA